MKHRLIFITGIDGSGKSYFSERLVAHLREQGEPVQHVWARFMNYTSKPLLGLCRLLKLSYKEKHGDVLVGYHDFEKSRLIGRLFMFFQLIDIQLVTLFKIRVPLWRGKTVVCERGPYDTLIDIAVDVKNEVPINSSYRAFFLKLLPSEHIVLYLHRTTENIADKRRDVLLDKNLEFRRSLYRKCAATFDWVQIDNNGTIEETFDSIRDKLALNNGKKEESASMA